MKYKVTEVYDASHGSVQKHVNHYAELGWLIVSHNIKFRHLKDDTHVFVWSKPDGSK